MHDHLEMSVEYLLLLLVSIASNREYGPCTFWLVLATATLEASKVHIHTLKHQLNSISSMLVEEIFIFIVIERLFYRLQSKVSNTAPPDSSRKL